MYHPTTRLLTILELLQSYPSISGTELAARLEVDVRTVRRYVSMLQELGIPVEAERGRYGSYHLRPGFKLPPLMFTNDEAVALTIGLLIAQQVGIGSTGHITQGALAKLTRVMPDILQQQTRALQDSLVVKLPTSAVTVQSDLLGILSVAAQHCQQTRLVYQSWQQETTERTFDSYGLLYHQGFWYTAGYCHLREELRTFRVDRVVSVELLDSNFQPPKDFDIYQHVMLSLATTPGTYHVEVLLKTTLAEAQKIISPALGTLQETADGIIFRGYFQQLDWIAHFLVGLECQIVIHEPSALKTAMRQLAAKIARIVETS